MSARRHPSFFVLPALALVVTGLAAQDQPLTLQLKFAASEDQHYRSTTESTVTMNGIPGMGDMTVTNAMTQTYTLTAEKVDADGTATVRIKFDAIRMNTSSPMMSMSYDSATGAAEGPGAEIGQTLGALIGESITMVVAPNGAVRSVEGMTKIKEKVANTPAMANAAATLGGNPIDSMMSDEAMKASFSQGFTTLPDKAVKPGDTWTTELVLPNPTGTQTVTSTFTLKGIERVEGRDLAKVAVVQTIKSAGGSVGPLAIDPTEGAGEGEILFDHKAGRVELATIVVTMPMTMSMGAPDGSSMSLQSLTRTKSTFGVDRR